MASPRGGLALGGWTDREVDAGTTPPDGSRRGRLSARGGEEDESLSPVSAALAELALYEAQEDMAFSRGAHGGGRAASPRRQRRHEVALSDTLVSETMASEAAAESDDRPYAEGAVSFLRDPLGAVDGQALDLKLAAERGEGSAQHEIARRHLFGVAGIERSDAEAARWLRKAAENGVVGAMYNLGTMLLAGRAGVAGASSAGRPWRDTKTFQVAEGARWFRKAADGGHAKAAYSLGVLFAKGQGVTADAVEAARWFRVARAAGVPAASYALGNLHKRGSGVRPDPVEAAKLWEEAVSLESVPEAAYNLGLAYLEGSGVARSAESARKWFEVAALPAVDERGEDRLVGSAQAAFNLGVMHAHGEGGAKSNDEALRWIFAAADPKRGNWVHAQVALGRAHAQGLLGLSRDGKEAAVWYRRAAAQGSKEAKVTLSTARLGHPEDVRPVPRPRPSMGPEEAKSTLHELRRRAWIEGDEDAAATLRAAGRDPEFVRAAGEACSNCGAYGLELYACSQCKDAMYCDAKCQEEHWNRHTNGHRFRCRRPGAENVDPRGANGKGRPGSRSNSPAKNVAARHASPKHIRDGLPSARVHAALSVRPSSARHSNREWSPAW